LNNKRRDTAGGAQASGFGAAVPLRALSQERCGLGSRFTLVNAAS